MSRYLIDRIAALPNVELHTGTEVIGLEGDEAVGLTGAVFRERASGEVHPVPCVTCSCSSAPIPTRPGSTAAWRSMAKASW